MIGWGDVYKVVSGMAPLYFALVLGYCSVRWWKLFTRDQCDAINRLVIYFALPFFASDFNAHAGTFAASYRVLAADAVAKLLVILSLAFWAAASGRKASPANYSWCITGFSLATLSNGLLVGAPLMDAICTASGRATSSCSSRWCRPSCGSRFCWWCLRRGRRGWR
jgi:auxin efflux carrier family